MTLIKKLKMIANLSTNDVSILFARSKLTKMIVYLKLILKGFELYSKSMGKNKSKKN